MSPRLAPTRSRGAGRLGLAVALAAAALAAPGFAGAQGFAAFLAPSRFDLTIEPGKTRREVLEFHHVGTVAGKYRVSTNDWEFQRDYSVKFMDELAPDSCRPWVAIERRDLTIPPNGKYRFRFEVSVPPGTASRECRFALMVEGQEPANVEGANLSVPVSGRVGVIVYVKVGEAAPVLVATPAGVRDIKGAKLPVLAVSNKGNAHGRLDGFLTGKDAAGNEFEMAPENLPVMPGMDREIAIRPVAEEGRKLPDIRYPITIKGTLEWGKKRETVEYRFLP